MTYSDFEARWRPAGGAERANYGLFLQDLCDLLAVPRPDPTTDNPAADQYVLERAVEFRDGGKKSTGRIDLYKRGCFILETKQGVNDGLFIGLETDKNRASAQFNGSTAARQHGSTAARQHGSTA